MSAGVDQGGAKRPSRLAAVWARLGRLWGAQRLPQPDQAPPAMPQLPPPLALPAATRSGPAASAPGQASLLGDGPLSPDPALFVHDLRERFRQALRTLHVGRKEPLSGLFELMTEYMQHLSELVETHLRTIDRSRERQERLVREDAEARKRAASDARLMIEALAREARHRQDTILGEFRAELAAALPGVASSRTWRDRVVSAFCLVVLAAGAYCWGEYRGIAAAQLQMEATAPPLVQAAMAEGPDVAREWLGLMQWNRLSAAVRRCGYQDDGPGGRRACTFTFWTSPPLTLPPPRER